MVIIEVLALCCSFGIFSVKQMSEVLTLYLLSLILNFALLCYLFMFQVLL